VPKELAQTAKRTAAGAQPKRRGNKVIVSNPKEPQAAASRGASSDGDDDPSGSDGLWAVRSLSFEFEGFCHASLVCQLQLCTGRCVVWACNAATGMQVLVGQGSSLDAASVQASEKDLSRQDTTHLLNSVLFVLVPVLPTQSDSVCVFSLLSMS
jgi:hypothetical protein